MKSTPRNGQDGRMKPYSGGPAEDADGKVNAH